MRTNDAEPPKERGSPPPPARPSIRVSGFATTRVSASGRPSAGKGADAPGRPKRVLVVDDQEDTLQALRGLLTSFDYEVELARDGLEALAKVKLDIDLMLLDATMPGLDGFEVARRVREDPEFGDLPIIMLTGLGRREDRLRAAEAGVNDFIAKPFEVMELRLRSASLLRMKEALDAVKRHRAELEQAVTKRTADLRQALDEMVAAQRATYLAHLDTIRRLVLAAECKERDATAHVERIGAYCAILSKALGLPPQEVEVMRYASQMHDVGKIGVPDELLLKPKLDDAEWEVIKQHTVVGARILHGSPSELLQTGEVIAQSHHERWDGSGYPNGLAGEAIPLAGRICAVADVFDELTSTHHYREALANQVVYEMLGTQRGHEFDPQVVAAFLEHREEVEEVQRAHRDQAGDATPGAGGP